MTRTGEDTRWFWLTVWLFACLTVIFVVWVSLRVGGARLTNAVDDIGELVAALVAAGACNGAARRFGRTRPGWGFLAASCFAWGCGEAVWCYYDLVQGVVVPFPSLADVGFLSAVPLAVVGLLAFGGGKYRPPSQLRRLAGKMLVGFAVFFAGWTTLVGLFSHKDFSAILSPVVGAAYPLGDLVMAAVVLLALRSATRDRTSLVLVLVGMLAFTVADTSFNYLTSVGKYGIGNGLDSGWVIGYLLMALGALWVVSHPDSTSREMARAINWTLPGPSPSIARGALGISVKEMPALHAPYAQSGWFTKATADRIVYSTSALLILADAGLCLYDLALMLKMLS